MIEPNLNNLMWIILVFISVHSIALIVAGSVKMEKETKYGSFDIFTGLMYLVIIVYFVLLG